MDFDRSFLELTLLDPSNVLQCFIALATDPNPPADTTLRTIFCDHFFPGWLQEFIVSALPFAHVIGSERDKGLVDFIHHLWDNECDCWWSFHKQLTVSLLDKTITFTNSYADCEKVSTGNLTNPSERNELLEAFKKSTLECQCYKSCQCWNMQ